MVHIGTQAHEARRERQRLAGGAERKAPDSPTFASEPCTALHRPRPTSRIEEAQAQFEEAQAQLMQEQDLGLAALQYEEGYEAGLLLIALLEGV